MITVIIGHELEDHVCTRFTDKGHFRQFLSAGNDDTYFINVSDEIWSELKTKNSKRLELTLDEINELIQKASFVFLIKKNYAESCTYYPKGDDP